MLDLLGLDGLTGILAAALTAILVAIGAYLRGRSAGSTDAKTKARERDNERSKEIETVADRARAADDAGNVDSLERLRANGHLRD